MKPIRRRNRTIEELIDDEKEFSEDLARHTEQLQEVEGQIFSLERNHLQTTMDFGNYVVGWNAKHIQKLLPPQKRPADAAGESEDTENKQPKVEDSGSSNTDVSATAAVNDAPQREFKIQVSGSLGICVFLSVVSSFTPL